jgi:hypothetical protein
MIKEINKILDENYNIISYLKKVRDKSIFYVLGSSLIIFTSIIITPFISNQTPPIGLAFFLGFVSFMLQAMLLNTGIGKIFNKKKYREKFKENNLEKYLDFDNIYKNKELFNSLKMFEELSEVSKNFITYRDVRNVRI